MQFIPAEWLELAAWTPGLVVYSQTVEIERRANQRAERNPIEQLLRSILLEKAA